MLRILLILVLIPFLSSPAFAGFKEGRNAYNNRDWVGAVTELRPLAATGSPSLFVTKPVMTAP